jgi:predicted GNAT family N-acyltransferase
VSIAPTAQAVPPAIPSAIPPAQLAPYCAAADFAAGQVLREKGAYYRDLYLIAEGRVAVQLADGTARNGSIELGPGSTIGEIGFLRGSPASARVVASEPSRALVVDDGTIGRIEAADPDLAVRLSRFLAATSDARRHYNDTVLGSGPDPAKGARIEVLLCRDEAMLEDALRLRYEVYCGELGRDSPYADHERRTIRDTLDDFGHTLIAFADGEPVGTVRCNLRREGDLGMLLALYGMDGSAVEPDKTCVATKFIVRKSHRGSAVALQLLATLAGYLLRLDLEECYIDCIPALLPYYKALGFTVTAQPFHHYENGLSHPMKLTSRQAMRLSGHIGLPGKLRIYLLARFYRWQARRERRASPAPAA